MSSDKVYITSMEVFEGNNINTDQKVYKVDVTQYEPMLESFQTRNVDRISKILLATAVSILTRQKSVEQDFKIDKDENNNYGVILGTQFSALDSIHNFDMVELERGALAVNPGLFPNTVLNSPACQVSIKCSFAGPVYTVCNGMTSSLDAIGMGYNFVRTGLTSMTLAGGIDEITELQLTMKNDNMELGEAGGFLLLENSKTIAENKKLAEIIGYKSKVLNREERASLIETIVKLISEVMPSQAPNVMGITNISVSSVYYFSKIDAILDDICKKIEFTGIKECVKIDWMGACGIVQANRALKDMNRRCGEKVTWMLIDIDRDKISILALKNL